MSQIVSEMGADGWMDLLSKAWGTRERENEWVNVTSI